MILRRVITHVREQNWTAIGIDFVIVVTGVFIGIQVSNWNASTATCRARTADPDSSSVLARLRPP